MRLRQITPFVPCTTLDRQIAFYRDVLGFNVGYRAENYAFLHRDAVALRLIEVGDAADRTQREREMSFYVDVEGLDDVYVAMKPKLDMLPEGRVRAPFDQDYGQREFHVLDEDWTLVFFGEPVAGR